VPEAEGHDPRNYTSSRARSSSELLLLFAIGQIRHIAPRRLRTTRITLSAVRREPLLRALRVPIGTIKGRLGATPDPSERSTWLPSLIELLAHLLDAAPVKDRAVCRFEPGIGLPARGDGLVSG
jgi:hypothetical protein